MLSNLLQGKLSGLLGNREITVDFPPIQCVLAETVLWLFKMKTFLMHFEFYKHLQFSFNSRKLLTVLRSMLQKKLKNYLVPIPWHEGTGSVERHLNFPTQAGECLL